jgi:GAF domain-containing protein
MPSRQGFRDLDPLGHMHGHGDESVEEVCRHAVERLSARLPGVQVSCHVRSDEALRVVTSAGGLRLIYEIGREQGGICWRAVETGQPQLVEDVRADPDYMATDERVRAEIVVPIHRESGTLFLLDAEFPDRAFTPEEAEAVTDAAAALERELAD